MVADAIPVSFNCTRVHRLSARRVASGRKPVYAIDFDVWLPIAECDGREEAEEEKKEGRNAVARHE